MDAHFWHKRWERGEIGFHESQVNPALVDHLARLHLAKGARLFLPLCGKTPAIAWLLAQGYRVAGAELSPRAIDDLFQALELRPEITHVEKLMCYSAANIHIWVGDIFDLSSRLLGPVDAIYDRAALVALPEEMRQRYAAHLTALTHGVTQLLVTYEYDQGLHNGPPFSVDEKEVRRLYGENYQLNQLTQTDVAGGLKGKVQATVTAWLLQKHQP